MGMWISKGEYDESGPTIVHRKCFSALLTVFECASVFARSVAWQVWPQGCFPSPLAGVSHRVPHALPGSRRLRKAVASARLKATPLLLLLPIRFGAKLEDG